MADLIEFSNDDLNRQEIDAYEMRTFNLFMHHAMLREVQGIDCAEEFKAVLRRAGEAAFEHQATPARNAAAAARCLSLHMFAQQDRGLLDDLNLMTWGAPHPAIVTFWDLVAKTQIDFVLFDDELYQGISYDDGQRLMELMAGLAASVEKRMKAT